MKTTLLTVIGAASFMLAGCILPPRIQEKPIQSPPAHVPIKSALPAPVTETVTPTPTIPAPTSTGTSIPAPDLSGAATSLEETFTDNRNNWFTDSALSTVGGGKYNQRIDCPDSNAAPQCGRFIKMPFTFPRNFRLEIDATLVKSSAEAGIIVAFQVRRSDVEYYLVSYFITDGAYQVSYISQYSMSGLTPEIPTDFIKKTTGETNRLGVETNGASLTPIINEHRFAPVNNGKIPKAGTSYLVILIDRGYSAELQFDNLLAQKLN